MTYASSSGDPWADPVGNRLVVDVRTGCFGGCGTEASDWASAPTAVGVAELARFTSGVQASGFSTAGVAAINRSGITQVKLRFEQAATKTSYTFVKDGAAATLTIEY